MPPLSGLRRNFGRVNPTLTGGANAMPPLSGLSARSSLALLTSKPRPQSPGPRPPFPATMLRSVQEPLLDKRNLGEMLLAANLIDEVQMHVALAEQQRTGKKFGSTLVELKFIDENVLAAFLSKQIDIPCISLFHIDIPKKLLRRISGQTARDCRAIPIRMEGTRIEVAMVDPTDLDTLTALETELGTIVIPLIAPQSSIEKMIERFYPKEFDADDTQASRGTGEQKFNDPNFRDLIEELDSDDMGSRLDLIEDNLQQIWTLLEKILRIVENQEHRSSSVHGPK